jgi:hypothetical protein
MMCWTFWISFWVYPNAGSVSAAMRMATGCSSRTADKPTSIKGRCLQQQCLPCAQVGQLCQAGNGWQYIIARVVDPVVKEIGG